MENSPSQPRSKKRVLKIILAIVLILVAAGALARFVIFKTQFEQWGAGLERIEQWQTEYKKTHPNASKEEMDAAFRTGIDNITKWKAEYKAAHPGATDAEADAEFNRLWNK